VILRKLIVYLPFVCLCLFLVAGAPPAATLQLQLTHVVNGQPLVLQGGSYINAAGEAFNITLFKYYLSNFSLTTVSGETITLPPAYFLVDEGKPGSKLVKLPAVPPDTYRSISFLIGVDSVRNMSGAQTGALDPVNGMFWTWNSGYIMAKLEGTSPVSKQPANLIEFHIGGFKGARNALRRVQLTFPQPVRLTPQQAQTMQVVADAYAWFQQPNVISFQQVSSCSTPGAQAMQIADNYQHMFSIKAH
jgi:hypothetical protein